MSAELPIIEASGLSKRYRLGSLGASSVREALESWWSRWRKGAAESEDQALLGQAGAHVSASRFGDDDRTFWALRDISFEVRPGEVVGILGTNGAGKSTLLKMLSRITEPSSGRAVLRGRVASLLEVGTGFHPDLSGRENIFLNGAILGMKRSEIIERFDEIVDFAEIGQFIETPVKRYSSGMYTRLAFAIAAHLESEILLVDEVLAVGDAGFQKKCMGKMKGVAHAGRTVLFVSHNIAAMEQLCDRCLYLADGRLRRDGPSREVIAEYQRQFSSGTDEVFNPAQVRGDGRVLLHSYQVMNAQGEPHPLPLTGESLEIHLRMQVKEAIAHPACGVTVWNAQGVVMLSMTSVDYAQDLPPLPEGDLELVVRLRDVPFNPGSYTASFWVMSPQWHIYACAEAAIAFEIGQNSTLFGSTQIDHRYGCVYVPIDYEWTPAPAAIPELTCA